jgi:predicted dehydrogenase
VQSRLRSGIIGTGFMGDVHARAVRAAGGQVTAVASRTSDAARAAAARWGTPRAAGVEDLLTADDVDVVHICTPNNVHEALALRALAAGKHVVCEKPLATTVAAARALAAAARDTGRVAAVPFVYRFYPTVRDARERIRRGDLGRLVLLHGSYLQDWLSRPEDTNWRVDPELGGASRAFGDIGVHWCDLVEFTTGHRIKRLCAQVLRTPRPPAGPGPGTEDGATVMFATDLGALGSVVISQVSPGRKNRLWFSLDGAEASVQFNQELPESLWIGARGESRLIDRGTDSTTGPAAGYNILPPGHPQGYQDCFTAFVADVYAAAGGAGPDTLPAFDDGLRAALLTEAVLASAASGSWVEVPPT